MNLDQIATKCFILALFIRDDGERLLLGDGFYDFNQKLQHFQANTIANDIVEIQGDNGQLLAGQVMRSGAQKFEGYIGDATTSRQIIEQKRSDFMAFFRIKHFYHVIYILPDGTAIQRRRGYLTDAPAVPEIFQKFPEYSIALNFEDANYYEYAEDEHGDEIYAHIIELALSGNATGGLVWDAIGAVSNGISWSGIQTAQGEYISITNALDIPAKLASVEMLGKAEQDGTPTPDAPVAVETTTGENVVKIEGKNIYSDTWENGGISASSGANNSDANIRTVNYVPVLANTTYTASCDTGTRIALRFYNSAGTYLSAGRTSSTNTNTFTTPANTARVRFVVIGASGTTPNFQLELGSTATAYETYQGQDYAISLGTIELAKIGNYQDRIYKDDGKWYIEKQVGKQIIDGTTIVRNDSYTQLEYAIVPKPADSFAYGNYDSPIGKSIATCATAVDVPGGWNYSAYVGKFSTQAAIARTWIGFTKGTSLADMQSALDGQIIYYALATPTTTEITNEALIAQLDALESASLYLGLNNIGTETQNAVPTLKIEYYTEYELEGAGYEWEPGGNTAKTIVTVAGVDSAWPIWTVQGGAQNPTLTNITTGQTISWQGFVPEGQTLTINMAEMTADLAGANVFEYITGEWIRLAPGNNTLVYTAGSADKPSTLSWNGVLA